MSNAVEGDFFSQSDIDGMLPDIPENVVFVDKEELEVGVEIPYWRFDRSEFYNILRLVSRFPSNSTVYCALQYQVKAGIPVVRFVASNRDHYIETCMPLFNDKNIYESDKVYFFSVGTLLPLVSMYSDFLILFSSAPYFYTGKSQYELDLYSFDMSGIEVAIPDASDSVPFSIRKSVFNAVKSMSVDLSKLVDVRVQVQDNHLLGDYSIFNFDYNFDQVDSKYQPFYLRKFDITLIAQILSSLSTAIPSICIKDGRVFLYFSTFVFSFFCVPCADAGGLRSLCSDKILGEIDVGVDVLYRSLHLYSLLGHKSITFVGDGSVIKLVASINSWSTVGAGSLSEDVEVSLDLIKPLVSMLPVSSPFIKIIFTDTALKFVIKESDSISHAVELARISRRGYDNKSRMESRSKVLSDKIDSRVSELESALES